MQKQDFVKKTLFANFNFFITDVLTIPCCNILFKNIRIVSLCLLFDKIIFEYGRYVLTYPAIRAIFFEYKYDIICSYPERWRDWPDETRQLALQFMQGAVLNPAD